MMPIAYLVELTYKLLAAYGMKVPQLTPSRIRLLSRSRTFSCSKANDRLGYTPIIPLQVPVLSLKLIYCSVIPHINHSPHTFLEIDLLGLVIPHINRKCHAVSVFHCLKCQGLFGMGDGINKVIPPNSPLRYSTHNLLH